MSQSVAVQALSPEGKAKAQQVYDYQRSLAKMSRAVHGGMRKSHVMAWAVALLEAGALYHFAPLIRVVPVYVPVQSDGTMPSVMSVDPSTRLEGLKHGPADISAALWQYVRWRESYNWADAKAAWDIVSGMSSNNVRRQFQDWYVYTNKASPQAVYGFKDAVKLSWVESRVDGDRYTVTFWRQLFSDGSTAGSPQLWVCPLAFSTTWSAPLQERLTYNPGSLAVTAYPGCYPKGEAPGGIALGTTQ